MNFDNADDFVAFMTEGQPSRPANIHEIIAINQGRSELTMGEPSAEALTPAALAERLESGGVVVDGRDSAAFGTGHIPGAYNIKMASPEFEQRVGWVVPGDADIFLVLDDDAQVATALHKLAFVGLDSRATGFLAGGMDAWAAAGRDQDTLAQISVTALQDMLESAASIKVLDVREDDEWTAGHIAGTELMSFKVLEDQLGDLAIGPDDEVAVVCAGGVRSSTACSILQRHGYQRLLNVTGGMGAWRAADLPTTTD